MLQVFAEMSLPPADLPDLPVLLSLGRFPWHPELVDVVAPSVSQDSRPFP